MPASKRTAAGRRVFLFIRFFSLPVSVQVRVGLYYDQMRLNSKVAFSRMGDLISKYQGWSAYMTLPMKQTAYMLLSAGHAAISGCCDAKQQL